MSSKKQSKAAAAMDVVDKFTYRVTWSDEDAEFVGLCAELPSLSHLDLDPDAAHRGIRALVADVVADMRRKREKIPEPLSQRKYSGEFKVRIPEALHRSLVMEAAEQNVSMNRLVSMKLAHG
jgi:predicted HicB family RNase H-like nuclease